MSQFYIGTVLLEKNRWSTRVPSFRVSDWLERFVRDGFDGIELWEHHLNAADDELLKLEDAVPPVSVYNLYADFSDASKPKLAKAAESIRHLHPTGVKFNFGDDADKMAEYRQNLLAFAGALPVGCTLLCEVHQGTVLEDVNTAAAFFKELPADRFQIITHAFSGSAADLQKQFDAFGSRISLVHVQYMKDNARVRLDRSPGHARECLRVLEANGFTGDFTMEFTEGTQAPDETIEMLYENALLDMRFIKENWTNQ